jgi:hypothetical protein
MDGTGTKQDTGATQHLPTASATEQGTSTPKTFTEEQVVERELKAVSDYASRTGRAEETLIKREQTVKEFETRKAKEEQERELAALEAVKDKPEELSIVERRRKLAADIRAYNAEAEKFQAEKALHTAELAEAKTGRFEMAISGVAEKNNVSGNVLKDWAAKRGITDLGLIEDYASVMPKKTVVIIPDSGKNAGGGEDISRLSPRELISRGLNKK